PATFRTALPCGEPRISRTATPCSAPANPDDSLPERPTPAPVGRARGHRWLQGTRTPETAALTESRGGTAEATGRVLRGLSERLRGSRDGGGTTRLTRGASGVAYLGDHPPETRADRGPQPGHRRGGREPVEELQADGDDHAHERRNEALAWSSPSACSSS